MKKLISLFFCALMILSLFATAFAVPPAENDDETLNSTGTTQPGAEPQDHIHNWIEDSIDSHYESDGSSGCHCVTERSMHCSSCGATHESTLKGPTEKHSGPPYDAYCNGVEQTWKCICNNCNTSYTEIHTCWGRNHKNGCECLPV